MPRNPTLANALETPIDCIHFPGVTPRDQPVKRSPRCAPAVHECARAARARDLRFRCEAHPRLDGGIHLPPLRQQPHHLPFHGSIRTLHGPRRLHESIIDEPGRAPDEKSPVARVEAHLPAVLHQGSFRNGSQPLNYVPRHRACHRQTHFRCPGQH